MKDFILNNKLHSFRKSTNGRILHLDGDKRYSEKSNRYYKKAGLDAIVKYVPERKQPIIVKDLLLKYEPDILVVTGHDSMLKQKKNYSNINNYRNSKYFIQTVLEARRLFPSSTDLTIIAGACQSFFEAIIAAGANFASSPARILIDFRDPLIIASRIAQTSNNKFITIDDLIYDLRDGKSGINGIGSMGKRPL